MDDLLRKATEDAPYIIALRHKLHRWPELSGKEFQTTALIAEELKALGLEISVWPGEPGVVALLRGAHPGKTLALRADIDALPLTEQSGLPFKSENQGVMHACGHDLHTSVLLGAARVLTERKSNLHGNIKFIFQSAEEHLLGARQMLERGVMENPRVDHILSLHCWPELSSGMIGVKTGAFMASSDTLTVTLTGKAGHAAHPHQCVDPVVAAAAVINAVQTVVSREVAPVDATVITFGIIRGGTAANIIAPSVELQGTVRTTSQKVRDEMPSVIRRIVEYTAAAYRCKGVVQYVQGTPPVLNDRNLTDLVERAAGETLGTEKVMHLESVSMGSEDFAFYLGKVPGAIFRLGTGNQLAQSRVALHNPEIVFDDKSLLPGVITLSAAAVKYLEQN